MTTKPHFLAIASLWILALGCSAPAVQEATPLVPNFVVVLADDMGFSDAGCYGGEISTPNLDAMAREGLRFTQFYSTGRCWPSRASLLTGYYAQQVGMDLGKGKKETRTWPPWTQLVAQHLKPANYRCYHSGKWHVRHTPADPEHSGFDRSYWTRDHNRFFNPKTHFLDDSKLDAVPRGTGYYATTAIADRAIQFLQEHETEHEEKPFFLYLAFIAPHFPLHALQEDIDRYRDKYRVGWDVVRRKRWERMKRLGLFSGKLSRRRPDVTAPWSWSEEKLQEQIGPGESAYAVAWDELTPAQQDLQAQKMAIHAAMVDRVDQEIGRVMKQVSTMGEANDTVFIFVSDNGASAEQMIRGDLHDKSAKPGSADSYLCLGPGWSTAANAPLALHKHWNHEGGIASPLIIHWPAGIKKHSAIRRTPGHFIDLVPTILDLAEVQRQATWGGVEPPPFPGRSLRPAFDRDPYWPPRELYFNHAGNRALRRGDWKAVLRTQNDERWELYNLDRDRAENHDLSAEQPRRLAKLVKQWEDMRDSLEQDRLRGTQPTSQETAGDSR